MDKQELSDVTADWNLKRLEVERLEKEQVELDKRIRALQEEMCQDLLIMDDFNFEDPVGFKKGPDYIVLVRHPRGVEASVVDFELREEIKKS